MGSNGTYVLVLLLPFFIREKTIIRNNQVVTMAEETLTLILAAKELKRDKSQRKFNSCHFRT